MRQSWKECHGGGNWTIRNKFERVIIRIETICSLQSRTDIQHSTASWGSLRPIYFCCSVAPSIMKKKQYHHLEMAEHLDACSCDGSLDAFSYDGSTTSAQPANMGSHECTRHLRSTSPDSLFPPSGPSPFVCCPPLPSQTFGSLSSLSIPDLSHMYRSQAKAQALRITMHRCTLEL